MSKEHQRIEPTDESLGELVLNALRQIYVASCLSCRHNAVRVVEGQPTCDWCGMAVQEARQRIFLGRLLGG